MANPVGGFTKKVAPTVTVSTSPAYTSGDVVGGEIELEKVFRREGGTAILQSVFLTDEADQDPVLELLFFDANPAGAYTDNAAVPTLGADTVSLVGRVSIAAGDWGTLGGVAMASVSNLGRVFRAAAGSGITSLWMVMVTTSTPTFVATDDLRIILGFLQD